MNKIVVFRDLLEDSADLHYGILLDDETILCLCCLGTLEKEDYEIIDENPYTSNIDDILKEEWDFDSDYGNNDDEDDE